MSKNKETIDAEGQIERDVWNEFWYQSAIGTEATKGAFLSEADPEQLALIKQAIGKSWASITDDWHTRSDFVYAHRVMQAMGKSFVLLGNATLEGQRRKEAQP